MFYERKGAVAPDTVYAPAAQAGGKDHGAFDLAGAAGNPNGEKGAYDGKEIDTHF